MIKTIDELSKKKTETVEYDSLNEFYKYICDTPFNEAFRWASHSSVDGTKKFTQTQNFEEAVELFKNGWSDMSTKLTQKIKVADSKLKPMVKPRNQLSVAGYQAIVPLYLNGVPNNMVDKRMVPIKQKVVNITKSISYRCDVTTETIIDESIKALQIVKKLEAQGIRCNLYIAMGSKEDDKEIYTKIKIKSASEKLNVSKLAFPLVHPSMLRRLMFRFIEVHPTITRSFVHGYGLPAQTWDFKKVFKDDYILPAIMDKEVSAINSIDDLQF